MIHRDKVADLLDKSRAIKLHVGRYRVEYDLCNGYSIFFMYEDDYGEIIEYITFRQNEFGKKYGYDEIGETHYIKVFQDEEFLTEMAGIKDGFLYRDVRFYQSLEEFINTVYAETDKTLEDANERIGFKGQPMIQQMVYLGEWS